MQDQVIALADKGKALAPAERSRLVDLLLESLHEPSTDNLEELWAAEIDSRLAAYDRGDVKAVDAANVFAKARSIAG